ncbi:spore photoproduct lyase family protein [Solidesulfovibrio sp.]
MSAPLWDITALAVDAAVADTAMAARARAALPDARVTTVAPGDARPHAPAGGRLLHIKAHLGRFLRPCPATRHYRCCGYQIIHIGENCPMDCSYCILRAYFRDRTLTAFANTGAMFAELAAAFGRDPSRVFRVGTGQFADSLALEPITGHTRELLGFLAAYDNVSLELKSKTADLSWLEADPRPNRVLPSWSVNAPAIVAREERDTAPLAARLAAARTCARAGFRVCLHFDPICHFPDWEREYAAIIDLIFDYLSPADIAYMSLGSFRCLPELPGRLAAEGRELPAYMLGEFAVGADGKKRLLRPLRVRQFRFMAARLAGHGFSRGLYFCMESDEVWRAVLGRTPRDLGGLAAYLLDCARNPGG